MVIVYSFECIAVAEGIGCESVEFGVGEMLLLARNFSTSNTCIHISEHSKESSNNHIILIESTIDSPLSEYTMRCGDAFASNCKIQQNRQLASLRRTTNYDIAEGDTHNGSLQWSN